MDKQFVIHLMLASSSSAIKGASQKEMVQLSSESKNKYAHLIFEQKGTPLSGVSIDIQSFTKCFEKSAYMCKILKTSKHQKCLLTKKQILNQISSLFEKNEKDYCCFYYSGHAYPNGDWAIETVEHPDGDRLTFHQFFNLWKNRKNKTRWTLQVLNDSCYSGQWAVQFKKHCKEITNNHQRIYIINSSGPNLRSRIVENYGSLLFGGYCKSNQQTDQSEERRQLFKTQQPNYVYWFHGELSENMKMSWKDLSTTYYFLTWGNP